MYFFLEELDMDDLARLVAAAARVAVKLVLLEETKYNPSISICLISSISN